MATARKRKARETHETHPSRNLHRLFLDGAMGLMPLHINRCMRTSRTEVLAGTTADTGLHIDHRDLQ